MTSLICFKKLIEYIIISTKILQGNTGSYVEASAAGIYVKKRVEWKYCQIIPIK